jgi:hypothetical protein
MALMPMQPIELPVMDAGPPMPVGMSLPMA